MLSTRGEETDSQLQAGAAEGTDDMGIASIG